MTEQRKESDDEIDLSKVKDKIKGLFKSKETKKEPHPTHQKDPDQFISADFKQIKTEIKKHAKWLIPLACILIAMTASIYLRTMPQRLPISNDWAENSVNNFYRSQLKTQVDKQYPYLPQANKDALVEKEWQKYLNENKDTIEQQTGMLAKQYQETFKDENGTLYLLGIDPYYYYRQTYYVLHNGYPGTSIREGVIYDDYRLAPLGREGDWNFHNWFGALWHRILNLFGSFPIMYTFFFVGTIFSALTVIPGFFIGKKLTNNNAGGIFTAFLLAVSSFFVSRTTGESSDTDVYAVFFPVLITWLFLESLTAEKKKWKFAWMIAAGFATGLFAFAWTGWWYIALFLLATLACQLLYLAATNWKTFSQTLKSKTMTDPLSLAGAYALSVSIFVSLFTSFHEFTRVTLGPLQFASLKSPLASAWPNIKTTVAELNVVSLSNVIQQLGGKLLFLLAIVGIIFLLLKKNKEGKREPHLAFFIALWLVSSLYATSKGVRFILQATPVFSIALGTFLGLTWSNSSKWISKELKLNATVTKALIFVLLALLLIQPAKDGYSQAFHSAPSMNDAWYSTLSKIKNEAPQDITITSWWDFGHWFKAIADRPVTFDGGTQTSWGAYWVGRSFLTDNEQTTVGILRMLNCGQNNAFKELDKEIEDTPKSVEILNEIIVLDKNNALKKLETYGLSDQQAEAVTKYTHCENPPIDYYITSEDMIGKSGVWGHFGSWNFKKSVMHQKVKGLEQSEAIEYLTKNFGLSETEAEQHYAEIKSTPADSWVAPWPGHLSGLQGCEKRSEKELRCVGSIQGKNFAALVNIDTYDTVFEGSANVRPDSIVYATKDSIEEKKFAGDQRAGFSIVLIPNGDSYVFLTTAPQQAASMFTKLYFFNGHGQKCFRKFDQVQNINGGAISTWIVDYKCKENNKVFFKEPATV